MNQPAQQWVGIDVSKATLDVHLEPSGQCWSSANNQTGIDQLVDKLGAWSVLE